MASVLVSEAEKVYVLHGVQEDLRCDGRGRKDVRPIVVETDIGTLHILIRLQRFCTQFTYLDLNVLTFNICIAFYYSYSCQWLSTSKACKYRHTRRS